VKEFFVHTFPVPEDENIFFVCVAGLERTGWESGMRQNVTRRQALDRRRRRVGRFGNIGER
jgi:hypothetical protein